jgi:O-antigen/teichoic acid export membrane protein
MSRKKLHDSLSQRIFKGSLTVIFFTAFTSPLAYLIKILYSRTLSMEAFGLFYAVLALFLSLSSYVDLGFGYSLVYFTPKYLKRKDYQTCWNLYRYTQIIGLATSLLMSFLVIITAKWLSLYYFKFPGAEKVLYIFVFYLIAGSLLSALQNFFTGLQQEKHYAAIQSIRTLFALIFSLIVLLMGKTNITYYASCWVVAIIFVLGFYSYILKKENSFLFKKTVWNKKLFMSMLRYALPSLSTSVIYIFVSSEIIFLTLLKGVREVGIYSVILPIVTMSSIILTPINTFLFPLISHLMEKQKGKIIQLLQEALKIIPFIGFYFALFITLFPNQPVQILFGSQWVKDTRLPLVIFSLGYVGYQISNLLSTIVVGIGRIKDRFRASIILAVINIPLSFVLISRYSVTGATIISSLISIISILLNTAIVRKTFPFNFPFSYYLKLILVGILAHFVVITFKLNPQGLTEYIFYGINYTILFLLSGHLLKLFDKNMLKSLLKIKPPNGLQKFH